MITAPALDASTTTHDNATTHVYCCNPDRALCGHDVSNDPEVHGPTDNDCVVCLDLEDQDCPDCDEETA